MANLFLYYLHEGQPIQSQVCVGQTLDSLQALLTEYTAAKDFISNCAFQLNSSFVADSRTRIGHRGNVVRFPAGIIDFSPYLKRQIALGTPSVVCDVFRR